VPAIAQTLSIGEAGDQPLFALVKSVLKEKHLLLLLDNFEQVSDAALQISDLLPACPKLKVLVTSRVGLHVRAEREFAVSPLSVPNTKRLPDLLTLSQYEAVALFIARAQAAKPDFQVTNANAPAVAGICARLDGLPLAIELAAARVKYFSLQALLARLEQGLALLSGGARDLPARQQTLRGAIAWSYDLLSPQEQALFRRLAVFVDGCTVEAAAQVGAAAGELAGDVLETLLSLVDKSLLRQAEQEEGEEGEPRFLMLQVLREYGLECLASTGELEATRTAHALYYLARAEEAEPHLRGSEADRWFVQMEQEHENQRAALSWLLERAGLRAGSEGEKEWAELAMRLCSALYWFWNIHGYYREGRSFLERALAVREGVTESVQVKVLSAASVLAVIQDDLERAEALCRESLALFQLGYVAWARCQYAESCDQLEEAVALFQELGDTQYIAVLLSLLGEMRLRQGEQGMARELLEESVATFKELGDRWSTAEALLAFARVASSQGEFAAARARYLESLAIAREIDARNHIASVLEGGAMVAAQGEPVWAARLCGAAQALRAVIGAPLPPVYRADYEGALTTVRTHLGEETFATALAEGGAMALEQALDVLPLLFSRIDKEAVIR
jgi:predicted ATPase